MYDLINNPGSQDAFRCNPNQSPLTFDSRCGDSSWVVWKQPLSPSTGWNYVSTITGQTRVAAVPSIGVWPYQWPTDRPKTGVPGQVNTLDFKKINDAFPNPPKPSPHGCRRELFNPNYLATGAANTKVVAVNGIWYMAFNETINEPSIDGHWTSGDIFRVGWATSTDGRIWVPSHLLFRAPAEENSPPNCAGGFVITQLFTDSGYFYMLVDEFTHGLILLRAQINTSLPDGFSTWDIATNGVNHWTPVTIDAVLDPVAVNATRLMFPMDRTDTQQGAIARVFNSSAPNSSSSFVAVTVDGTQLKLFSSSSLDNLADAPFVPRSSVDLAYLKPRTASFGWEFGFTSDANNTSATPTVIGREFDFWLNGNFYPNGTDNNLTGISFTGYRTTATLSGDIYSPRGALRSFSNFYLSAAADNSINAAPTSIGLNERWVLIDVNGGTLQPNDVVNLQARNGLYVTNNGGATLAASQAYPMANETFIIEKKNGAGTIITGDLVALRSQSTGKYIIATAGGGSTVFGNGVDTNPNTRFTYTAN
jgi:hypothetical protein